MPATEQQTQPVKETESVEAIVEKHLNRDGEKDLTPVAPPPPSWRELDIDGDDVPAFFKGKKVPDVLKSWEHGQAALTRAQQEAGQLRRENEDARMRLVAAEAIRSAFPQQQKDVLQLPEEDPRLSRLDELLLTGDMPAYRALFTEINNEQIARVRKEAAEDAKESIRGELNVERGRERGENARQVAFSQLMSMGVTEDQLNDVNRGVALYSAITRRPTEGAPNHYYDYGGPTNPNVIVAAWRDLYGLPAAPISAAPVAPQAVAVARPPIAAPPGGSKPSPAAGPAPERSSPLRSEVKRAYESLADDFGLNKERLLNRRGKGASNA